MSKLAVGSWAIAILVTSMPQAEKFSKYKSVEAYEVRPRILMMPRYSEDGQICEIGLEPRRYLPDLVRVDPELSRKEIEEVVDELAPAGERGQKLKEPLRGDYIVIEGNVMTTTSEYDNVTTFILTRISPRPGSGSKNLKSSGADVAAVIRWNHRQCR